MSFTAVWNDATAALILKAKGLPAVTVYENDTPCAALRRGEVPPPLLAFLEDLLAELTPRLAVARAETARQMWEEYAEGPGGGWRAAGDTDVPSTEAFAEALGEGAFTVFVDPDGAPGRMEIWWDNKDLFLGHSVFVQVFDPAGWRDFDASIFG